MTGTDILELLDSILSAKDLHSAGEQALVLLKQLLPGDLFCVQHFSLGPNPLNELFLEGKGWLGSFHPMRKQFANLLIQPGNQEQFNWMLSKALGASGQRTPEAMGLIRSHGIRDLEWEKTMVYQLVQRPNRIGDMATLWLQSPNSTFMVSSFRSGKFDHHQSLKNIRRLARVVGPMLARRIEPTCPLQSLPFCTALSPRENEVLASVEQGLSNEQIAHHLQIRFGTVRKHMENIFRKLGVQSRTAAIRLVRSGHAPK